MVFLQNEVDTEPLSTVPIFCCEISWFTVLILVSSACRSMIKRGFAVYNIKIHAFCIK